MNGYHLVKERDKTFCYLFLLLNLHKVTLHSCCLLLSHIVINSSLCPVDLTDQDSDPECCLHGPLNSSVTITSWDLLLITHTFTSHQIRTELCEIHPDTENRSRVDLQRLWFIIETDTDLHKFRLLADSCWRSEVRPGQDWDQVLVPYSMLYSISSSYVCPLLLLFESGD